MDLLQELAAVADSRRQEVFKLPTGGELVLVEMSASDFVDLQKKTEPLHENGDFSAANALTVITCCKQLKEQEAEALQLLRNWPRDLLDSAVKACARINGLALDDDEKKTT